MNGNIEKTNLVSIVSLVLFYSPSVYSGTELDPATVVIDEGKAVLIATKHTAGSFLRAELEEDDGRSLWEVVLLTTSGSEVQVSIDADTAEIVDTDDDDDEGVVDNK